MTILGNDNRTIVNEENFEFFDSIVAVDDLDSDGAVTSVGSGVIVSPQHVLTAAHVIFDQSPDFSETIYDQNGARVIFADDVQGSDHFKVGNTSTNLRNIEEYNTSTEEGLKRILPGAGLVDLEFEDNPEGDYLTRDYDIALLNISEDTSNYSESVEPLGIVAFVDPEDALGLNVFTADIQQVSLEKT